MIGIVISRADSASVLIGEHLLELEHWREEHDESRPESDGGGTFYRLDDTELRVFDDLHLHLDGVDTSFCDCNSPLDLLVFASRHAGETGPLLSTHVTGNFGSADYGGHDDSLARAAPNAQVTALSSLMEHAPDDYDVGMEGTHHGPTEIDTPSLFVELGSDEQQWNDPDGARAVARAILALRGVNPDSTRTVVGFGGGHYVPRFERVARETDWTVGHVAVDWALDAMSDPDEHRPLIREAFEQSGTEYALIDGDVPGLEEVIRDLDYRIVSETWTRETTDIPLELVTRIEREVATVENGLRFGERASQTTISDGNGNRNENEDDFTVIDLPADLLAEANGIDRARTLSAVRALTVAVTTDEGGTRLADTIVLPEGVNRNDLLSVFVTVLETKYDTVKRDGDQIVVHETAFSPALARAQGVPEGPAFGRLSNGQDVEVDGTTVSPSVVEEERTHVFSSLCLSDVCQTSVER